MSRLLSCVGLLIVLWCFLGCGSQSRPTTADDGHGHGASYACGTQSAPVTLLIKDVAPAVGTTVPSQSIVQQFTLVDAPFMLTTLKFVYLPEHTAGTSSPNPLQFTVVAQGKDLVFASTADSWSTAPGHVEVGVPDMLATDNGCVFVFPSPLFSYDVTSP